MVSVKVVFCRQCCSHYTSSHCKRIKLRGAKGVNWGPIQRQADPILNCCMLIIMVMFAEDEEMLSISRVR